jgi:ubiquitin-conjugating enzyme E2 variant
MRLTPSDAAPAARKAHDHGAYRYVEIGAVLVFFVLATVAGTHIAAVARSAPYTCVSALVLGVFGADLVSGLVHWAGDTWGTEAWPIIGKSLIAPFRIHHTDEEELTLHGFFEINGSNCLVSLPVLAGVCALPLGPGHRGLLFCAAFLLSLCVWVLLTNQLHKWAHEKNPSRLVRLLQRCWLVLPPEVHRVHHTFPFVKHYCITTGWLNGPLDRIDFFRRLERLLTWITGAEPRAYMKLENADEGLSHDAG